MPVAIEMSARPFAALARKARTVNQASVAAGRTAMLINGGASVAMLAVFASIWSEHTVPATVTVGIATAVLYYALGLLMAAMTSGVTFISQRWSQQGESKGSVRAAERVFELMNAISTALIVGAWSLFLLGTLITYRCFSMSPWFIIDGR